MDEHTTTKPARSRPWRRRRHQPLERPHIVHRTAGDSGGRTTTRAIEQVEARTEGSGGSSGRGPADDDDGGRKPDRNDDDGLHLLIALGLIALGGTLMRALAKGGRLPRIA